MFRPTGKKSVWCLSSHSSIPRDEVSLREFMDAFETEFPGLVEQNQEPNRSEIECAPNDGHRTEGLVREFRWHS